MRKIIFVLLTVITTLLSACEKKNDYCGTWKAENVAYETAQYTVKGWKAMDKDDFTNCYIILSDEGKAYVYDGKLGKLSDWSYKENIFMIDDKKCEFTNGCICYTFKDTILYFEKISDDQSMPKNTETNDKTVDSVIEQAYKISANIKKK